MMARQITIQSEVRKWFQIVCTIPEVNFLVTIWQNQINVFFQNPSRDTIFPFYGRRQLKTNKHCSDVGTRLPIFHHYILSVKSLHASPQLLYGELKSVRLRDFLI